MEKLIPTEDDKGRFLQYDKIFDSDEDYIKFFNEKENIHNFSVIPVV